jgi:23S rRNA (adenine2503-C2)-methyltransferase
VNAPGPPRPLLAHDPDALAAALGGPGRAQLVLGALRRGLDPLAPGVLPPKLAARVAAATSPTARALVVERVAEDGTVKRLLRLHDGLEVEMVVIPTPGRSTVCVSSQVGCVRGCRFCMTGTMGVVRSLAADEIAAQVVEAQGAVRAHGLAPLRNVVFMGMGEPLDNLDAVSGAIGVLARSDGLGVGHRHVTVSTVGPSAAQVRRLAELPTHVAWSLHAADDVLRAALVPTARASVAELRDAFADVCRARRAPLFVELTLIDGVNDAEADAARAAALFEGFPTEVRVNLLPMNGIGDAGVIPAGVPLPARVRARFAGGEASGDDIAPLAAPIPLRAAVDARVDAFAARLRAAGRFVMVRRARGAEARSACGQLASEARGKRGRARLPVVDAAVLAAPPDASGDGPTGS